MLRKRFQYGCKLQQAIFKAEGHDAVQIQKGLLRKCTGTGVFPGEQGSCGKSNEKQGPALGFYIGSIPAASVKTLKIDRYKFLVYQN
jgi:hypothetical protein